jgi:hypothetical protein
VPVRERFPNRETAQDDSAVFEEPVRQQLTRVLRSSAFTNAPSLSRFLSYLVDRMLQGNSAPPDEYTLGVEVFDRRESFDPSVDNIVRVQVRRLRSKLEKYHDGPNGPAVLGSPSLTRHATFFRALRRAVYRPRPA